MSEDTYLMMVDGKVQAVDLSPVMRRHRAAHVRARAAMIGQVVDLLAVESVDAADLLDASGLGERDREDACHVALTLRLAELGELDGE